MLLFSQSRFKGALLGLRQFLATESLLSWLFGHVAKRLDKKDKADFKFYDVTVWLTNNCNTHIDQYLEKEKESENGI